MGMAHDRGGALARSPRMTKSLFALAALFLADFALAAELPDPVPVRIIHINDFHGNLESSAGLSLSLADPGAAPGAPQLRVPVGGAPALAGLVKSLRAGSPHSVMIAG